MAILKLLVFTDARKNEIEALRWSEVNFASGYLKLADSKTGQNAIPLNAGALQDLNDQRQIEGNDHVFLAYRGNANYEGTPKVWKRVRAMAGLTDVRLHDLRHSFASIAVSGGAMRRVRRACFDTTQQIYPADAIWMCFEHFP